MTDAITIPQGSNVQDPYIVLRRMLNQIAELKSRIKPLTTEMEALQAQALDLAGEIQRSGLQHPQFVLRGINTKPRRYLDVPKLREKFPDLYRDACPYVDEKTICKILADAKPDRDLQGMVRELDPAAFDEAAKIRIRTLEKVAGKRGMQQLEDLEIVKKNFHATGEPELWRITEATPRKALEEPEEDEDE